MRRSLTVLSLVAVAAVCAAAQSPSITYRVDPAWPKMPDGMFFGTKGGFPDPATREQQARASRGNAAPAPAPAGQATPSAPPMYGTGVSGLAIDDQDRVYVFNRGNPVVIVFDRSGNFVRSGGNRDMDGKPIAGGWSHSGTVDWDGDVWVIERDAHRIIKFTPTLDKAVMQLGTTGEKGVDGTHLNLPNGIVVLRNGNIVVTDGYGNNRVVMFDKNGRFIKQVGKGAGGPDDRGTGNGEFGQPHKLAIDSADNIYVIDRPNSRIQVFDKNLTYLRQYGDKSWVPWGIAISRKGTEGFGFFAEHNLDGVHKFSLADGKTLAKFGKLGRGPGEFDSLHGLVVDSQGAVYGGDTLGQRVQKFVPVTGVTQVR